MSATASAIDSSTFEEPAVVESLDPESGETAWKATVGRAPGNAGTVAATERRVKKKFSRPRLLVSFDAHSGERQWRFESGENPGRLSVRGISEERVIAEAITCSTTGTDHSGSSVAVVGFDRDTGEEAWRVPGNNIRGQIGRGVDVGRSTIAWIESTQEGASLLRTVDAADGEERWTQPIATGSELLAASDDVLVVETPDHALPTSTVNVYDRDRGTLRWTISIPRLAYGGIAAAGTSLVAVSPISGGGPITVYDNSGQARWRLDGIRAVTEMQIVDNVLIARLKGTVTTDDLFPESVLALALDTGAELWRGPNNAPTIVEAIEGTVFVESVGFTPETYALDAETGDVRWRSETDTYSYATRSPANKVRPSVVAASDLAAIALDDEIVVRDLETGKPRWRRGYPDGTASVAMGGGSLFVAGGCTPVDPH